MAQNEPFLLYGPKSVGKSSVIRHLEFDTVSCVQLGTLVTSLEQVDLLIEYLEKRFAWFEAHSRLSRVFVMEDVQAVCPLIESGATANLVEFVKSNRVATWLLNKVKTTGLTLGVTCRHYSQVNAKLL